jgi:hypothetical protein
MIIVLPQGDQSYRVDWSDSGPAWDLYTARDIVEHIDAHFRTIADPSGRAIGGLSMVPMARSNWRSAIPAFSVWSVHIARASGHSMNGFRISAIGPTSMRTIPCTSSMSTQSCRTR